LVVEFVMALKQVSELNKRNSLQSKKYLKSYSEIRVDIDATKWLYSRFITSYYGACNPIIVSKYDFII
jgi:hypothetical protein